jgi:cytochrome b6-f complex iron-sulfur subunit
MNPLVIVIPVVVVLAGVVLFAASRRRDSGEAIGALSRETRKRDVGEPVVLDDDAEVPVSGRVVERQAAVERRAPQLATVGGSDLAEYVPPDADAIGVTRRQFFNRSIVLLMGLGLTGFGAAVLAFLWPQPKGGFGSAIRVGNIADIEANIAASGGFLYLAEGRMWITQYPASALEKARAVYPASMMPGLEAGVIAVYQKCPHLGCRVPECETSQWFECPCHGSQYNQAGEKKGGPAPRGMDHFAMSVTGGALTVDTGTIIQGPPIGTNTTGQEAEGPNCISAASH